MSSHYWLRALKGVPRDSVHVLLWQDEEARPIKSAPRSTRLLPGRRRLWRIMCEGPQLRILGYDSWNDPDTLCEEILKTHPGRGALTVWTARGWSDLVLTGLAELIDRGEMAWRYAQLDGAKCLFRGALRGLSTVFTSLPCWTGSRWDAWPECVSSLPAKDILRQLARELRGREPAPEGDEALALATLCNILSAAWILKIGTVSPTVAGAARKLWRSWLGLRVWSDQTASGHTDRKRSQEQRCYVAPIPTRPDASAHAERHVCYGMPREQFRTGRIDGPIYVVDIASAYLIALLHTPQPMIYRECLRSPSRERLAEGMSDATGLALVLIDTHDTPYPVRRKGQPGRAIGRYWTWLCGAELAQAIAAEHVRECHTAWLWSAKVRTDDRIIQTAMLRGSFAESGCAGLAAVWRALYCSCVGQFATWAREWKDIDYPHSFGRWACWSGADHETGREVRYRSIAGRVQRLEGRKSAPGTVPLLFGCVTAALRHFLACLHRQAGQGNVLALAADSLWLNAAGWQGLQRAVSEAGLPPDNLRVKATYEKVWMNGKGRAVVRKDGKTYAVLSGVPHDLPADKTGRVVWSAREEWSSVAAPSEARGIRVAPVVFDALRFVQEYDHKPRCNTPWMILRDGQLIEELLTPRSAGKDVLDE